MKGSLSLALLLALSGCAAARHRLEPEDGKVLHLAGQSPQEFGGYSAFLSTDSRPLGYTTYHSLTQLNTSGASATFFDKAKKTLDSLGDADHAVLPHIGLALTPGGTVLDQINAGAYDLALSEFAAALPRVGRPAFIRIGCKYTSNQSLLVISGYTLTDCL